MQGVLRRIALVVVVPFVALAALVAGPGTGHASSGGGCGAWEPLDPCISYNASEQRVYADFYMNVSPDCFRYTAILEIINKNGSVVNWAFYSLNRTGRYGPISVGTATLPPSNGNAYARVKVYDCWTGAQSYATTSPRVYYP